MIMLDLGDSISCEHCTSLIPVNADSKVHQLQIEQGMAFFFICPVCDKLQRPRIIKDNKMFLVNLSDEQMHTLQVLYKLNL